MTKRFIKVDKKMPSHAFAQDALDAYPSALRVGLTALSAVFDVARRGQPQRLVSLFNRQTLNVLSIISAPDTER